MLLAAFLFFCLFSGKKYGLMFETREQRRSRIINVSIIAFSHFAHDVYTSFLAPLLPLLIKRFSLNYVQAAWLNVIRGLPTLLNPFIGAFVDKKGGKAIVILAPTIAAISMSLVGIAPSYGILGILLFVAGVNSTFYHVPSPVMVKKISKGYSGAGMGLFMVGGETARFLGPLVVMGAVSLWGLNGIWRLIPFGLFASILLFFRLKRINLYSSSDNQTADLTPVREVFAKVYKFFVVMFFYLVFRALVKTSLTYFLPTFLHLRGASLWLSGAALSILEVAGIVGTFLGGWISDLWGRFRTLLISSIVTPILVLLFVWLPAVWSLPLLILIGLFMFVTGPVLLAYVHDLKTDRPAFVNSLYMISNFFVSSIASLFFGWLGDKIGMINALYLVSFLSFGAVPVLLLFKKVDKLK